MAGRVCSAVGEGWKCENEGRIASGLCMSHYIQQWTGHELRPIGEYDAPRLELKAQGKKRCPKCGEAKSFDEFNKNKSRPDGRSAYCRSCDGLLKIIRNMGLTETEYETLFLEQGGVCALCSKPPGDRRLSVDHDHNCCSQRGRSCGDCVRGFLCNRCNTGGIDWYEEVREIVPPYLLFEEYLSRRPILRMRQAGQLEGEENCLVAP